MSTNIPMDGTVVCTVSISIELIHVIDSDSFTVAETTRSVWYIYICRCIFDFVIVLLIGSRDKQEAKACARADLPHSIPLCALQSFRSSSFALDSFSCSLAAIASPRLFSCLLFASWACKPTTHKPFKMKPNRL